MRLETKKYLYDINRAVALLIQFTAPTHETTHPRHSRTHPHHSRTHPHHSRTHPHHSREGGNLQQDTHAWNNGLLRLASG